MRPSAGRIRPTAARPRATLRDPRLVGLAAAGLVHLLAVGFIVLDGLGGETRPTIALSPEPWALPLDLRPPSLPRSPSPPRRHGGPLVSPRVPEATVRPRTSPPEAVAPSRSPTAAAPPDTAVAAVEDRWRVGGRNAAPRGGDVCRDLSNFRAWQAADCRTHGPVQQAAARGSPPAEVARPAPDPGRAPGQSAQDAFARQAAANTAWRDYTRGDGAYPGLRSLATQH